MRKESIRKTKETEGFGTFSSYLVRNSFSFASQTFVSFSQYSVTTWKLPLSRRTVHKSLPVRGLSLHLHTRAHTHTHTHTHARTHAEREREREKEREKNRRRRNNRYFTDEKCDLKCEAFQRIFKPLFNNLKTK